MSAIAVTWRDGHMWQATMRTGVAREVARQCRARGLRVSVRVVS